MQGETWEQNRKLLLRLGTNKYWRPIQLRPCEIVFDTPRNRLVKPENHVEPFGDLTFVYRETILLCTLFRYNFPKNGLAKHLIIYLTTRDHPR